MEIVDATGAPAEHRFMFNVPGAAPAFGQIRSGGSIRASSANVSTVEHEAGTGVYCIAFTVSISQAALESAVVALHAAS